MARPRKVLKFAEVLNPLKVEELRILRKEAMVEIRLKEREALNITSEKEAFKIREKLKIGQKVTFNSRGGAAKPIRAEVIGIFAQKVQVEVAGRKRSVALTRITSVE